jgi:diguanylate cyclase (GGDEF)-like protein
MIDIDNFKSINDAYGHHTGDKVIELSTKSIYKNLKSDSVFGRVGGEEFAMLCGFKTKKECIECMQAIREEVEKLEIASESGATIKFTISLGVSKIAHDTQSLDALLKKADKALYEAKDLGRNRVIFAP